MEKVNWKMPVFDLEGWAYREIKENYPMHPYWWRCQHPEKLVLGRETDIGCFTYMNAKHGIKIGFCTQIGSHCSIYSESTIHGRFSDVLKGKVIIGNNVMIGTHSVIMPGVMIGNDAVVGACSFVNRDIEGGSIVGGVPIRTLDLRSDNYGQPVDKTVRCIRCDSIMIYDKSEVIRDKLVDFFSCSKCNVAVSIKEHKGDIGPPEKKFVSIKGDINNRQKILCKSITY